MDTKTLDFIYKGGQTVRYHTHPVLRRQNIADHSFHVAMLAAWLCGQDPPGISVPLLMGALTHDLAEHIMGDLPAPVKRSIPQIMAENNEGLLEDMEFRAYWGMAEGRLIADVDLDWTPQMTPAETRAVKLADNADGCLYCIQERRMGNKALDVIYGTFREYYASQEPQPGPEQALLAYIDQSWEQAIG